MMPDVVVLGMPPAAGLTGFITLGFGFSTPGPAAQFGIGYTAPARVPDYTAPASVHDYTAPAEEP